MGKVGKGKGFLGRRGPRDKETCTGMTAKTRILGILPCHGFPSHNLLWRRNGDKLRWSLIADEIVQDGRCRLLRRRDCIVEETCSIVVREGRMSWCFGGDGEFETVS